MRHTAFYTQPYRTSYQFSGQLADHFFHTDCVEDQFGKAFKDSVPTFLLYFGGPADGDPNHNNQAFWDAIRVRQQAVVSWILRTR